MVSSGAIAEGMKRLGWAAPAAADPRAAGRRRGRPDGAGADLRIAASRALGLRSAQVLLTHADLADRERYLNARSTLVTLLELGVVPVINENDTVVNDEIKFGDNDTLAALVTNLIEADALVILTDQAGLFSADPRRDPRRALIASARGRRPRLEPWPAAPVQRHRARRHAHQGARRQARGAQRREHGHRLGPRDATSCCAWRPAKPSAPRSSATTRRLTARKQWMTDHLQLRGALSSTTARRAAARRRQEPAADRRCRGASATSIAAT